MVSTQITQEQIDEAVAVLKKGGVVVFPTETAYGLAADATNEDAVEKVRMIKGRDKEQALPLIAFDHAMIEEVAGVPAKLQPLTQLHWPGALTLILPVIGDSLALGVVKNETIAIRISSHPVARALSEGLGSPIVSTSANRNGEPACYSTDSVRAQFEYQETKPDFYLDTGELAAELPSTIVGIDDYGYPEVLRQGSIEI